ncbi:flagellin [Bdellovibrio sp. HCB337]|uniref:flagellin N-terminal helical domain-containing protein n=1 Tax=Bdellovibrio sp. HCB337 TaxID=3394358 RepID=UPI0039A57901
MGLRIQTNMASISAQRVLSIQQKRAEHATAALASGSRIVKASDDAAGLAISENIRGQIRGIGQARNNAFNATSAIQVSEGGLNEVSNILIRLRELGVQAASDHIGERERGFLNLEATQLVQEADRIARTTVFGDKRLLDGSGGEMEFQVGAFAGDENIIKYDLGADATASELGIDGLEVGTKGDARTALKTVDDALVKVSSLRANFGAVQSRLDSTVANLDIQYENLTAANSRIRDTDVAKETSEMTSANILQQAAVGVLAQANQTPAVALKLL